MKRNNAVLFSAHPANFKFASLLCLTFPYVVIKLGHLRHENKVVLHPSGIERKKESRRGTDELPLRAAWSKAGSRRTRAPAAHIDRSIADDGPRRRPDACTATGHRRRRRRAPPAPHSEVLTAHHPPLPENHQLGCPQRSPPRQPP